MEEIVNIWEYTARIIDEGYSLDCSSIEYIDGLKRKITQFLLSNDYQGKIDNLRVTGSIDLLQRILKL